MYGIPDVYVALFILCVYLLILVLIFARLMAILAMNLVAQVPQMVQAGGEALAESPPIPNVDIKKALGYGLVRFFQSPSFDKAVGTFMEKLTGGKKPGGP